MRREILAIFLVVFVGLLGYSIIFPVLPLYAESFGATPFMAGLLFTSYAVCQFVAGPILGALSDKHGRKPWLIFSQIGTTIGFIVMGMAGSLPLLFAARILDGLSGGNIVIAQAYVSDITEPKDRAKTFGFIGIAFGLGFIIGPALGGILAHWGGYALPAYVAAGISLFSIFLTAQMLPETRREHHKVLAGPKEIWLHSMRFLRERELRLLLLEFFIFTSVFYMFTTSMTLYLERTLHASARELGLLYGYVGILVMIGQGGAVRILLKRFTEREVARIGFISCLLAFLLMMVATTSWMWTIVSTTFFALGVSLLRPTLTSIITQTASSEEQGRTLGVTQSVDSIALILGPIVGGLAITYAPISTFAVIEALGALFGVLLLTRKTRLL